MGRASFFSSLTEASAGLCEAVMVGCWFVVVEMLRSAAPLVAVAGGGVSLPSVEDWKTAGYFSSLGSSWYTGRALFLAFSSHGRILSWSSCRVGANSCLSEPDAEDMMERLSANSVSVGGDLLAE